MKTKLLQVVSIIAMSVVFALNVAADDEATAPSLYERLGAADGITKIVKDTIALHHKNPTISQFFEGVDDQALATHVVAFFSAGTGGPANYQGRDMTTAHATMDMSDADYDAAVADVLTAVKANGVDKEAAAEVAAILESLRPAVMGSSES